MKLYTTKMSDNTKQVRVDNWGIFFLQRLQMFFSKTDYCDMTLQFEGNVQLKVHRLVINACTEYFQYLEQTCSTMDDNVIMMPADLQADVIVPIVNFMYTGMLEFHLSIFDKLYKTAELMNITILTKLLDAQKQTNQSQFNKLKRQSTYEARKPTPPPVRTPEAISVSSVPRKYPTWKRKTVSTISSSYGGSSYFSESKRTPVSDPLLVPDNTPKPTRFEWPEDELPMMNMLDSNFEDISYTSKPLLTKEEELRASTSFDDIKNQPNVNTSLTNVKKDDNAALDMEEMKNYVKETKIRSSLINVGNDDDNVDKDPDYYPDVGLKRKAEKMKTITKKVRFDEQENKGTTINITLDGRKGSGEVDHTKILSEILKKYPQLVKKNKNIRLKIINKGGGTTQQKFEISPSLKAQVSNIGHSTKTNLNTNEYVTKAEEKSPWTCDKCSTPDEPIQFVLYYLYRKHMTDVHNEKFDPKLCKYCGQRYGKENLLMYHVYTKHGIKPPANYDFPQCDQCPFIAASEIILIKHKLRHDKNEMQCIECKLAFTTPKMLTTHVQITGHHGKSNKNNYDCQYCTKRFQSSGNLFLHVRTQHYQEGVRDGIVSINENYEVNENEEVDLKEEYILPEIINEPPKEKIKILSNVKMTTPQKDVAQSENQQRPPVLLEPSSEAEALNNVASGIATSLGLVDIVVLDENQQYILQTNEQSYNQETNEQPEFILPELGTNENFNQQSNEVMGQSMLPGSDITSTDELVMVLTDHDYGDNQEEINNDNSNIVVLYSHPVDGQQNQYITTSSGNIMLNSQTGMIEIRNGTTISTTSANQIVMTTTQDSNIESIEMIRKEIESHNGVKTTFVEKESNNENSTNVTNKVENQTETIEEENTPGTSFVPDVAAALIAEPNVNDNQTENRTEDVNVEEVTKKNEEPDEKDGESNQVQTENDYQSVKVEAVEENNVKVEEGVEDKQVDDLETNLRLLESAENLTSVAFVSNELNPVNPDNQDNISDTPPPFNLPSTIDTPISETTETTENTKCDTEEPSNEDKPAEIEEKQDEPMEIDPNNTVDNSETNPKEIEEKLMETDRIVEAAADQIVNVQNENIPEPAPDVEEKPAEDVDAEKDARIDESTKIAILDDWDDTDSQPAGTRVDPKVAGETVNKLMDDWAEDEDAGD